MNRPLFYGGVIVTLILVGAAVWAFSSEEYLTVLILVPAMICTAELFDYLRRRYFRN